MRFQSGPSPRAWGKHAMKNDKGYVNRTIPTGVGKTTRHCPYCGAFTDHPHGRGENVPGSSGSGSTDGPSPRAWGKPLQRGCGAG